MTNIFHHLFTPHESNNHKPRLLHHGSFLLYIMLFICSQMLFSILTIVRPEVLGLATNISESDLLVSVNQQRIENGLPPLKVDEKLSLAAGFKAQDMFSKNYWAHFAPDGTTPWLFIDQAGYKYSYAGENLARDFAVSGQVIDAWMKSPTHRKNILDSRYKDVGFAVINGKINGEETTLVVQLFGTKSSVSAQVPEVNSESPSVVNVSAVNPQAELQAYSGNENPQVKQAQISRLEAPGNKRVSNNPVLNVFSLTKIISLGLGLFLVVLLYIDAVMIFKKKIFRISGNNFAHIIFFIFLLTALFLAKYGVII